MKLYSNVLDKDGENSGSRTWGSCCCRLETSRGFYVAEAKRTTVVPIRILIRTTASYRLDRRADKNPYRHNRNMRFSSKHALFSILMVSFFKLCFIAVGSKHIFILMNALQR